MGTPAKGEKAGRFSVGSNPTLAALSWCRRFARTADNREDQVQLLGTGRMEGWQSPVLRPFRKRRPGHTCGGSNPSPSAKTSSIAALRRDDINGRMAAQTARTSGLAAIRQT
jgi:hypothetical protein